ncbi:MAG: GNAT family N-acetyltransferase [Clostridia bacterium]|nr:GNAT family N-acetyltransferase [Clostridia bacterium]
MTDTDIILFFRDKPVIETSRLMLVPPSKKYVSDMFEYCSSDEVTKFVTWNRHTDISVTKKYVSKLCRKARRGLCTEWFMTEKDTGKMIGTCGFVSIDAVNRRGEIGYAMNPAYRGNGYMTEAVKAVISFGFSKLGLIRIEAKHVVENVKSGNVMARAGMKREGVLRRYMAVKGENRDIAICSIISGE